jgi:hypothetical protein
VIYLKKIKKRRSEEIYNKVYYFKAVAELGHFGAGKQKDTTFVIWAKDIYDAYKKAKNFPRVSKVKSVSKITDVKELVLLLVKEFNNDLMCKNHFPSSALYTFVGISEYFDKLKSMEVLK